MPQRHEIQIIQPDYLAGSTPPERKGVIRSSDIFTSTGQDDRSAALRADLMSRGSGRSPDDKPFGQRLLDVYGGSKVIEESIPRPEDSLRDRLLKTYRGR